MTEERVRRTIKRPEHLINDFETDLEPLKSDSKPKVWKRIKASEFEKLEKSKIWECPYCGNELSSKVHNTHHQLMINKRLFYRV